VGSRTENETWFQPPPLRTQSESDCLPLPDASPARQTISEAILASDKPHPANLGDGESDRVTGTLVHRLLQRLGFQAEYPAGELRALASRLLRPGESDGITAEHPVLDDVVSAYRAICARSDVRALSAAGDWLHEVPFTMRMNGGLLRGTIDCLVRTNNRLTIIEFKTGRVQPQHQAQLELYRRAAERLFPELTIETLLIYSGDET
jgi:ATP-dependent helicase/nuclease subunit A